MIHTQAPEPTSQSKPFEAIWVNPLGSSHSRRPTLRRQVTGWSEMSVPSLCRWARRSMASLRPEHVGQIFSYAGKAGEYTGYLGWGGLASPVRKGGKHGCLVEARFISCIILYPRHVGWILEWRPWEFSNAVEVLAAAGLMSENFSP